MRLVHLQHYEHAYRQFGMQIYMLLFYLPFLVAYFDEPAHW